MAGYFLLELDTTSPVLEIYAPQYTNDSTATEIKVVGSELLATFQEIYFIDSKGQRFDFTFSHNGNEFVGQVVFNQVAKGIGVLYARLKDEVFNISDQVSKAIEIYGSSPEQSLEIEIDEFIKSFSFEEKIISFTEQTKLASLSELIESRNISESSKIPDLAESTDILVLDDSLIASEVEEETYLKSLSEDSNTTSVSTSTDEGGTTENSGNMDTSSKEDIKKVGD